MGSQDYMHQLQRMERVNIAEKKLSIKGKRLSLQSRRLSVAEDYSSALSLGGLAPSFSQPIASALKSSAHAKLSRVQSFKFDRPREDSGGLGSDNNI